MSKESKKSPSQTIDGPSMDPHKLILLLSAIVKASNGESEDFHVEVNYLCKRHAPPSIQANRVVHIDEAESI